MMCISTTLSENWSSKLAPSFLACKEESCISFAATTTCVLFINCLAYFLCYRGEGRKKSQRFLCARACSVILSGFSCVPVRWARCLDRFSAGVCFVRWAFLVRVRAMGGCLAVALVWWSASFFSCSIYFFPFYDLYIPEEYRWRLIRSLIPHDTYSKHCSQSHKKKLILLASDLIFPFVALVMYICADLAIIILRS